MRDGDSSSYAVKVLTHMTAKRRQEHHVYWLLIALVADAYLVAALVVENGWFGLNQLRHLGQR